MTAAVLVTLVHALGSSLASERLAFAARVSDLMLVEGPLGRLFEISQPIEIGIKKVGVPVKARDELVSIASRTFPVGSVMEDVWIQYQVDFSHAYCM